MLRLARAVALAACLASAVSGCGDAASGMTSADAASPDTSVSFDAISSDATTSTDAATTADTSTSPDVRVDETSAALVTLKDDDTYLVPGNVAKKTEVAAAGGVVAWVETPADGAPFFVVWDVTDTTSAPQSYVVPNLRHPRQLALAHGLLAYVDDRYGTPDVFGLGLERGDAFPIAVAAGAQERPTVAGTEVAWADCRACVTGDDGSGWEIYARAVDLVAPDASPAEVRVTDDAVPDRGPVFGLADGASADGERVVLAWVRGRTGMRVLELGKDQGDPTRLDLEVDVSDRLRAADAVGWVAASPGILAWRTRPVIVNPDSMIVNPDSMFPSDVFVTDIAGDTVNGTARATTHGELRDGMDGAIRAAAGRLAWLDATPTARRLRLVDATDPLSVDTAGQTVVEDGLHAFALGSELVAFIAPRSDNAGLDDLWVLPLGQ